MRSTRSRRGRRVLGQRVLRRFGASRGKLWRWSWFRVVIVALCFFVALGAACRHAKRAGIPAPDASRADARGAGVPGTRASGSAPPSATSSRSKAAPSSPQVVDHPGCLKGCPISERQGVGRLLVREGWVLFNNPKTKFADWAAYRVSPSTIGRSKPREWKADPDLPPEETLEPEDFRGARAALRTDRGHQVPLASFSGTRNYEPLNYMSNVTPQRSVLNQKLWNLLEQAERKFVLKKREPLFVVTGPLYEQEMALLPGADEPHQVPSGYFKVIAFIRGEELETAALIVQQSTPPMESYCEHAVTIDEVERRAGVNVFPSLTEAGARVLEREKGSLFQELGCL